MQLILDSSVCVRIRLQGREYCWGVWLRRPVSTWFAPFTLTLCLGRLLFIVCFTWEIIWAKHYRSHSYYPNCEEKSTEYNKECIDHKMALYFGEVMEALRFQWVEKTHIDRTLGGYIQQTYEGAIASFIKNLLGSLSGKASDKTTPTQRSYLEYVSRC